MCPREDVDDLLVERQQHNQNKAQWILVRRIAGYRRANDKGQWWESGASSKEGSEQNGKGRVPKKIPKRQANAESH